jgi:hypothetical protein
MMKKNIERLVLPIVLIAAIFISGCTASTTTGEYQNAALGGNFSKGIK